MAKKGSIVRNMDEPEMLRVLINSGEGNMAEIATQKHDKRIGETLRDVKKIKGCFYS